MSRNCPCQGDRRVPGRMFPYLTFTDGALSGVSWDAVDAGVWERKEPIAVLEGRALVWAPRHRLRNL
eukprot:8436280-Pyramimonas_sp.AAC.1